MRKTAKHLDAAEFSRFFSKSGEVLKIADELIWKADELLAYRRARPQRVARFAAEVQVQFLAVAENFGVNDEVSLARKVLNEAADYPKLAARAASIEPLLVVLLEQAHEPSPEPVA